MQTCHSSRLPIPAATALTALWTLASVQTANAHVKWFCAYDVAGQPRGLENVLCPDFELLVGMAMLVLLGGCLIDATKLGDAMMRSLDRATGWVRDNTELLFRAGGGAFFVALWTLGGIILTPELKTSSPAIPWLQLAIAVGMLSRKTMPLSALGIACLFGLAIWQYGIFHLADYPVFLGVACYLALVGLQRDLLGVRPSDLVRWSAAITLMWASVEKWAYPEWSFPLLVQHPTMTLGYDPEFFMRAAGVIEFTLAFALLWTPLVRRVAAILLAAMFVSAVIEFGKIDAIGHSVIIVVLAALVADDSKATLQQRYALMAPTAYAVALALSLAIYYLTHTMLFGSRLV